MKRALVVWIVAMLVTACGNGGTKDPSDSSDAGSDDNVVTTDDAGDGGTSNGDRDAGLDSGEDPDPDADDPDTGEGDDDTGGGTDAGPDADEETDMNTTPTTDPAMAGDLGTEITSETVDVEGESLELTIHLPMGAGPYPIVVFHHGFQLTPDLYESYGNHLASHGYVVVMPAMPGSAFSGPTHAELRDLLVGVLDWIEDDVSTGGTIGDAGDTSKIGLAGHSLGGKISLLTVVDDTRPLAVFGIDPVDSAPPLSSDGPDYPSVTPELMPDISVPIGLVGETVDSSGGGFGMSCAPAEQNFQQYYMAAVSPVVEVEIIGADHMDFLDDPNCGFVCSACGPGSVDEALVREYTRRYMTAFFDIYLQDSDASRTWLAGQQMADDEASGEVSSRNKNGF